MTGYFMRQSIVFILLLFLTVLLGACASATPLPPLPTRVFTPTFTPMSPPPPATPTTMATVTPTSTPLPLPSSTPTHAPPTATPEYPPIPRGMGGLIIVNNLGQELAYDIGNNLYRIPPKSKLVIFLSPGRHNFSATVPGYNGKTGTAEIKEGFYHQQLWG